MKAKASLRPMALKSLKNAILILSNRGTAAIGLKKKFTNLAIKKVKNIQATVTAKAALNFSG